MTREREAKLAVSRDLRMPLPEALARSIVAASIETVVQDAVYYDTADLRLIRAGASLRFRSDDGWTVKLPERRSATTLVRAEHAFADPPGAVPVAACELVRSWARTEPLVEVARIRTRRRRMRCSDKRGDVVVELADDDVTGSTLAHTESRFREIEVELVGAAPDRLIDEVVANLRAAGAETVPAMPKLARVLGEEAQAPPDLPVAPALDGRSTAADLVSRAIIGSVGQLLEQDPRLRLSDSVEAVHDARVATRRLRSDLRTFRPLLDPRWSEPLRGELRWLGGLLGSVRDADVLLSALEREILRLPPDQQEIAEEIVGRLRKARAEDRELLLEAIASPRYAELLERLVTGAVAPRLRDGGRADSRATTARRLTHRPWKQLTGAVRRLDREPADRDLHEVRKRAKDARYALEAVAPVSGPRVRKAAARLAALQDVLGAHQDAVVAVSWLADVTRVSESRDAAFGAGMLAGRFTVRQEQARAGWSDAWRKVRRAGRGT